MTKPQKAIVLAALGAAIAVGVWQTRRASRLLGQVEKLQQQQTPLAEHIRELREERDKATNMIRWLGEDPGRNERSDSELLRLRGAVAMLRQQLSEANLAKAQTPASMARGSQSADVLEQQKQSARTKGMDGRNYAMQLLSFAGDHQGSLPTNWQQVASFANNFPVTGTNEFELVHKRPMNLSDFGANLERTILVREYLAWPTADGQWGKIYGFADGHSLVVKIPDGDFAAWEKQNTFNPDSISP